MSRPSEPEPGSPAGTLSHRPHPALSGIQPDSEGQQQQQQHKQQQQELQQPLSLDPLAPVEDPADGVPSFPAPDPYAEAVAEVGSVPSMLASGLRPHAIGCHQSLHWLLDTTWMFRLVTWEVRSTEPEEGGGAGVGLVTLVPLAEELHLSEAASPRNPFFDGGALVYFERAGGAVPLTPFSSRRVLAAAVW
jgi:hypothetical protein